MAQVWNSLRYSDFPVVVIKSDFCSCNPEHFSLDKWEKQKVALFQFQGHCDQGLGPVLKISAGHVVPTAGSALSVMLTAAASSLDVMCPLCPLPHQDPSPRGIQGTLLGGSGSQVTPGSNQELFTCARAASGVCLHGLDEGGVRGM